MVKINNFINLSKSNLLISPFCDGLNNLGKACSPCASKLIYNPSAHSTDSKPLSLADRALHLVGGLALLIPVVNLVAYCAIRECATKTVIESPSPTPPVSRPKPPVAPPKPAPIPAPPILSATPPTKTASVLPYRWVQGHLEFLLGKENKSSSHRSWSAFGGKHHLFQTPRDIAAQKCFEEGRGLLGTAYEINHRLQSSRFVNHAHHTLYFMEVDSKIDNPAFQKASKGSSKKTQIEWVPASLFFPSKAGKASLSVQKKLRHCFKTTMDLAETKNVVKQLMIKGPVAFQRKITPPPPKPASSRQPFHSCPPQRINVYGGGGGGYVPPQKSDREQTLDLALGAVALGGAVTAGVIGGGYALASGISRWCNSRK
ncbi:MAG: hypothetical protein K2P51_00480 [Rhabdochlamydiaceae bacterium]|nr:hypothetical protein [Rhabdochlamydiaceae bacterium]